MPSISCGSASAAATFVLSASKSIPSVSCAPSLGGEGVGDVDPVASQAGSLTPAGVGTHRRQATRSGRSRPRRSAELRRLARGEVADQLNEQLDRWREGLVPAYAGIPKYSSERPRKPGGIGLVVAAAR